MCFNILSDKFLKCALVYICKYRKTKRLEPTVTDLESIPLWHLIPLAVLESIWVPFHKNKGDMGWEPWQIKSESAIEHRRRGI